MQKPQQPQSSAFNFFKVPPTPLEQVAQGIPNFISIPWLEEHAKKKVEEITKDLSIPLDERKARVEAINFFIIQKETEGWEEEKKAEVMAQFRDFLLGKSEWNDNPDLVPWGRKRLVGKDIEAYIEDMLDAKLTFDKEVHMSVNIGQIPRSLRQAWVYFCFKLKNNKMGVPSDMYLKLWETYYPTLSPAQKDSLDAKTQQPHPLHENQVLHPTIEQAPGEPEFRLMGVREGIYDGIEVNTAARGWTGGIGATGTGSGGGDDGDDTPPGGGLRPVAPEHPDLVDDPDLPEDEEEEEQLLRKRREGGEEDKKEEDDSEDLGDVAVDKVEFDVDAQAENAQNAAADISEQLQFSSGEFNEEHQRLRALLKETFEAIKTTPHNRKTLTTDAQKLMSLVDKAMREAAQKTKENEGKRKLFRRPQSSEIDPDKNRTQEFNMKDRIIAGLRRQLSEAKTEHEAAKNRLTGEIKADFEGKYGETIENLKRQIDTLQKEQSEKIQETRNSYESTLASQRQGYEDALTQLKNGLREITGEEEEDDVFQTNLDNAEPEGDGTSVQSHRQFSNGEEVILGKASEKVKTLQQTIQDHKDEIRKMIQKAKRNNQELEGLRHQQKAIAEIGKKASIVLDQITQRQQQRQEQEAEAEAARADIEKLKTDNNGEDEQLRKSINEILEGAKRGLESLDSFGPEGLADLEKPFKKLKALREEATPMEIDRIDRVNQILRRLRRLGRVRSQASTPSSLNFNLPLSFPPFVPVPSEADKTKEAEEKRAKEEEIARHQEVIAKIAGLEESVQAAIENVNKAKNDENEEAERKNKESKEEEEEKQRFEDRMKSAEESRKRTEELDIEAAKHREAFEESLDIREAERTEGEPAQEPEKEKTKKKKKDVGGLGKGKGKKGMTEEQAATIEDLEVEINMARQLLDPENISNAAQKKRREEKLADLERKLAHYLRTQDLDD